MRISDLSRQAGVPVATIKFYLREGLLPPGRPTGRNQAEYGEEHRRRLRLIRALTNVGQLDLSSVRVLLAAIENRHLPLADLYQIADRALFPGQPTASESDGLEQARTDVDEFIDGLGWQVKPDTPGRGWLAHVVAALRSLGCPCHLDFFTSYAAAAESLAIQELDMVTPGGDQADRAAAAVRTVLLEVALGALHRMANEHYVALLFDSSAAESRPS